LGARAYNVHRADLHNALRAALGDQHITLGARCVTVQQHDSDVSIGFADNRTASGNVLVGADSIHSVVRAYVAGPDQPLWSQQVAWRGLPPGAVGQRVGLERRQHSFWGPHQQFVTYYVSAGSLINWVGITPGDDEWREESWSARGNREDALAAFAGWHIQVRALIEATEQTFKWALFDRLPLETWTRGRVTLLGDAAHPMLPFLGQGAAQSIEDALVLARCLAADQADPERALHTYAGRRRERTAAIQSASRDRSRLTRLATPEEVAARNSRLGSSLDAYAANWEWIYGYDAESAAAHA
jgi:salicylate hydroxylase